MNKEIMVSVVCNAYNHEHYIRNTLEGFISQKTTFRFEVLVHDDASTDNTADIIREYESRYPDIIKPIYQIENQYSKGKKISEGFQYPRALGRYIAICEGDDYWIDPLKLQKQFDLMEKHPEIDICSCNASVEVNGQCVRSFPNVKSDCIFSTDEVISGGGGFVSTNSLFFRSELNKNIPPFRRYLAFDYTLQIHGALRGGMLYIGDCMSVYRYRTPGSWTVSNDNPFKKIFHNKKVLEMLKVLDVDTNGIHHKLIESKIRRDQKGLLLVFKYNGLKFDDECEQWYTQLTIFEKLIMNARYYLHLTKKFLKSSLKKE